MDDQLFVRWNNHQRDLPTMLTTLLRAEKLCDVTFSCANGTVKAHQAVLSASSPYFEALFVEKKHPHPIICLRDVEVNEMRALLDFMYQGEVNVGQHDLQSFLNTGSSLKVRGLQRIETSAAERNSTSERGSLTYPNTSNNNNNTISSNNNSLQAGSLQGKELSNPIQLKRLHKDDEFKINSPVQVQSLSGIKPKRLKYSVEQRPLNDKELCKQQQQLTPQTQHNHRPPTGSGTAVQQSIPRVNDHGYIPTEVRAFILDAHANERTARSGL